MIILSKNGYYLQIGTLNLLVGTNMGNKAMQSLCYRCIHSCLDKAAGVTSNHMHDVTGQGAARALYKGQCIP